MFKREKNVPNCIQYYDNRLQLKIPESNNIDTTSDRKILVVRATFGLEPVNASRHESHSTVAPCVRR